MSRGPDKPAGPNPVGKAELFGRIVESATDFAIFATDPNGVSQAGMSVPSGCSATRKATSSVAAPTSSSRPRTAPRALPRASGGVPASKAAPWTNAGTLRKDGSRFWASGLLMPLGDSAAGFVKITRDRTERHRAEERVRESEERFRLLATSIPQLVFRTRPDGGANLAQPAVDGFHRAGL